MVARVERRVESGREGEVGEGPECVALVMVMLSLILLLVALVRRVVPGDELGDGICGGGVVLPRDVSRSVVCVVGCMEECTGTIPNRLVVVVDLVLTN